MKAILIDDEKHAIERLIELLSEYEGIEVVDTFTNPLLALEQAESLKYDVAFLDIEMPGMKGIELAERLIELNPSADVVFITAYNQYAVDAFEINALDYLLKPISRKRMSVALERLISKSGETSLANDSNHICRITCFGRFQIETHQGEYMKYRTTKVRELIAYLVHLRGEIVNKDLIIENIWPEMDNEKAAVYLHTCIYQIRKSIKEFGLIDRIKVLYLEEGYQLKLSDTVCDVDLFMKISDDPSRLQEEMLKQYVQAVELYGGDYFENEDYSWAMEQKTALQFSYYGLLNKLADYYWTNENLENAVKYIQRLINSDPLQEEPHEFLMKVYAQMGNYEALKKHYYAMMQMFHDELDVEPRTSTQQLFKQLSENMEESKHI